ncbi:MAG TPA: alpha/beta hydrolase-fold protein [Solirubrobacterales bacterium]|nr:alpha/beta hydrolase-fold protein [Solirubrobacterales bacterium]
MRLFTAICIALVIAALAGCGSSDSSESTTTPAPETTAESELRQGELTVDSEAVGKPLEVSTIVPVGGGSTGKRPLLVFLHGAGGSNESSLENEAVLTGLEQLGDEAPVVAFPEGEESWWHDRASGNWGEYVVREVIPTISRRFRTDPRRVAIGGISMGGYGAYHLGLAYPDRFCAVGGHSAGLWLDSSEEYPGAFDDQADYDRNDVIAAVQANPDAFGDVPVWNDYGDQDWFVPGNAAFVAALESSATTPLTAHVWPGGHDQSYWDAHFPEYLNFYAQELANC